MVLSFDGTNKVSNILKNIINMINGKIFVPFKITIKHIGTVTES